MSSLALRHNPALAAATVAFAVGLAAILGAWTFEIVGHYIPCKLCLQQRIPYYAGLPVLVLAGFAAYGGRMPAARGLLALAAAIFAVGIVLGTYHAGAEWGWWAGPSDCATNAGSVESVGDLMRQLENIRIVSCTEASWRFLGLSFAGWNVVASFAVAALALFGAVKKKGAA